MWIVGVAGLRLIERDFDEATIGLHVDVDRGFRRAPGQVAAARPPMNSEQASAGPLARVKLAVRTSDVQLKCAHVG